MDTTTIQAIIFRRTIRASYASLDLIYFNKGEEKEEHIVAILQCPTSATASTRVGSNVSSWRSNIRRKCKLGTEIELIGTWCINTDSSARTRTGKNDDGGRDGDDQEINNHQQEAAHSKNRWANKCQAKRFQVENNVLVKKEEHGSDTIVIEDDTSSSNTDINTDNDNDTSSNNSKVKVIQTQKWDMIQCQAAREMFYPGFDHENKNKQKQKQKQGKKTSINKKSFVNDHDATTTDIIVEGENTNELSLSQRKQKAHEGQTGHGGGLGKRKQGEIVAEFLIDLVTKILGSNDDDDDDKALTQSSQQVQLLSQDENMSIIESRFIDFNKLNNDSKDNDYDEKRTKTIQYLNKGNGIMDVAGGSGHLSLALALRGIHSTVIDPRETVGKLPGRDRKALRKALKRQRNRDSGDNGNDQSNVKNNIITSGTNQYKKILPPPIEFSAMRAWFSTRPNGIDVEFREGKLSSCVNIDNNEPSSTSTPIPICTICSPDGLLSSCSAIVALHPDEATGEIVDFAVKHRVPFIVVPCCVFSRLFPHRYKPYPRNRVNLEKVKNKETQTTLHTNEIVSTYDDLIEYLVSKDSSIRVTKLGFEGANLALWSMFEN